MLTIEMINEIEENGLYDFLSNNYWKLDKETLSTMLKEFNYALYERQPRLEKQITTVMVASLKDLYEI